MNGRYHFFYATSCSEQLERNIHSRFESEQLSHRGTRHIVTPFANTAHSLDVPSRTAELSQYISQPHTDRAAWNGLSAP
jgi:hypothetical protein